MANRLGPQTRRLLERYGIGGLKEWASRAVKKGLSAAEIELQLYNQPEFKAAFPEIEARQKFGRQNGIQLPPLSPEDVIEYRAQFRQVLRSWGVPYKMWNTNEDIANFLVRDISLDEVNKRLELASGRVVKAPPEVRQVFDEMFGTNSDTALFTLFINPTDSQKSMDVLEEMVQQAEAGGAARRMGFELTEEQMGRVALANVDYGQAVEGFGELATVEGLFEETIAEEHEDLEVGEEGIEAVFGLGGEGRQALTERAERRRAETEGAAGGAIEERGATSLGGAGVR